MDTLTDLISTGSGYMDAAIAAGGVAVAWLSTKFEWWKNSDKLVKIGVPLGIFIAVAAILSVLN